MPNIKILQKTEHRIGFMEKIIGIHLNIPKSISKVILDIIKLTGIKYPRYYKFVPHLTLYRCRFPANRYSRLIRRLKALKLRSISLKINKVDIQRTDKGTAFLSLIFAKAKPVKTLHRKVLQPANELRDNLIRLKDQHRLQQGLFSKKEQRYIARYGNQRVLSLYIPHLTLGEVPLSATQSTVQKFRSYLRLLQKNPLTITTLMVGLYDYDNRKEKYTRVIREEEIALS